jgi:hypothetical protein
MGPPYEPAPVADDCAAFSAAPLDAPMSPEASAAFDKVAPAPADPLYWINHTLASLRAWEPGDAFGTGDVPALILILDDARKEIERLRALVCHAPVIAHNPDRAQIALLGALAADQVKTEQVKRDPDPTAPGAPGERVERRG